MKVSIQTTKLVALAILLHINSLDALGQKRYGCVDEPCVPYNPPVNAAPAPENPVNAAPAPPQQEYYAAPTPPAMYVAPAPTGERVGETRSYGLPEIQLTLPSITLSTPKIRIQGFQNIARDSFMRLDAATAPQFTGAPAQYAPLAAAGAGQARVASAAPITNRPVNTNSAGGDDQPPVNAASPEPNPSRCLPRTYCDPCTKNESLKKTYAELAALQQQIKLLQEKLETLESLEQVPSAQTSQTGIQQVSMTAESPNRLPESPEAKPISEQELLRLAQLQMLREFEEKQKAMKSFEEFETSNPAPRGWKRFLPKSMR